MIDVVSPIVAVLAGLTLILVYTTICLASAVVQLKVLVDRQSKALKNMIAWLDAMAHDGR